MNLKTIRIWDLPTRLFHWSLVLLVGISWTTSEIGGNAMQYHMWSGYAVLTLVLFRVLWGIFGSDTARFTRFLRGPSAVQAYARKLFMRDASHVIGHNPLGGWMVAILLLTLLAQAGTGLFANDDIVTEGPLYKLISKELSDLLTAVHEGTFNVLMTLVTLHIAAIVFYRLFKRDDLVRPMLTGKKVVADDAPPPRMRSTWLALPMIAFAAGAVYWLVVKL